MAFCPEARWDRHVRLRSNIRGGKRAARLRSRTRGSSAGELMSVEPEFHENELEFQANSQEVEIFAVDDMNKCKNNHQMTMVVDSGAGVSVFGPLYSPGYELQPSEEQRRGVHYLIVQLVARDSPTSGRSTSAARRRTANSAECGCGSPSSGSRSCPSPRRATRTTVWRSRARTGMSSMSLLARRCTSIGMGTLTTLRSRRSRLWVLLGRRRSRTPETEPTPRKPARQEWGSAPGRERR